MRGVWRGIESTGNVVIPCRCLAGERAAFDSLKGAGQCRVNGSRDVLNAVFDHFYASDRVLEHRWRNGDIIVWDNIALQHERGNLETVGKRVLQRAIVGTHGVVPHIAVVTSESTGR